MMASGIKANPFGTTSTRFPIGSKKIYQCPGPGTYETNIENSDTMIVTYNKMMRPMTQATSYMFKSTSTRFPKVKENKPPISNIETPSLKDINTLKVFYNPAKHGSYGFYSSVSRFKEANTENMTPGPGNYYENKIPHSKNGTKKQSLQKIVKNEPQPLVGPGSYNPSKEIKRSFNVSMDVRLDNV